MNRSRWCWTACAWAALLTLPGTVFGQASFKLPSLVGWVMAPDQKTLIVSPPSAGRLIHYRTVGDKEVQEGRVEFQPGALAVQGQHLFAIARGTASVHVLDLGSGKHLKTVKVP